MSAVTDARAELAATMKALEEVEKPTSYRGKRASHSASGFSQN